MPGPFRLAALLVLGGTSLSACALIPDQRPDVSFVVKTCAGAASGGQVKHNECFVFDGSDSHVFVSGKAKYRWTVQRTGSVVVSTAGLAEFTTAAGTGAVTPGDLFFKQVLEPQAEVAVTLTVTDGHGLTRSATRDLVLTNTRPTFTNGVTYLRPRTTDMFILPFVVAHLPIVEPEGDHSALDVVQISPPPGPGTSIQWFRCTDVPTHAGTTVFGEPYPDPGDGDPNALCFTVYPIDDPTTAADETQYYGAPAFADNPVDLVFRIRVREEEPDDPTPPQDQACTSPVDPATGEPAEVVGCIRVRVDDVLWTASSSSVEGGQITRVASGWQRAQPATLAIRNGDGMTEDSGGRVWFAGALKSCFLQASCAGGLVGYAGNIGLVELTGLGTVKDVHYTDAGPSGPGLWVSAVTISSNGNPGAIGAIPAVHIPAGVTYDVFVPYTVLSGAGPIDLSTITGPTFTYLYNYEHNASVGGDAVAIDFHGSLVPGDDGQLWIATNEYCGHLAGLVCSPTTGAPGLLMRLRRIPAATLAASNAIAITDASMALDVLTQLPPGNGAPFDTITSDGSGGLFSSSVGVSPNDPQSYASTLTHFSATGVALPSPLVLDRTYALSLAYDPAPRDVLWISDIASARIRRIADPLGAATITDVPELFSLPANLHIDATGALWIDDHPNDFTRRPARVEADGSATTFFGPYGSTGRGIAVGVARERGAWRPDLFDAVRAPIANPEEVPAALIGPIGSALAGIDPQDAAAYVFTPNIVGGVNFFRVSADGESTPLLALSDTRPICAAVVPDLPTLTQTTSSTLSTGSLWLCLPDPSGSSFRLAQIELRRLRAAARDGVPAAPALLPCGPATPSDVICERASVPLVVGPDAFVPATVAFSLLEFRLYVLGDAGGKQILATIFDPAFVGNEVTPPLIDAVFDLAANGVTISGAATQPMAPALILGSAGSGSSSAPVGGVWLLKDDSRIALVRIVAENPSVLGVDAALEIPRPSTIPGVLDATAIASDVLSSTVWRTWDASRFFATPTAAVDRSYIARPFASPSILECGVVVVPSHAQVMAVNSWTGAPTFNGSAWVSGDEENLVRIRSPEVPHTATPNACVGATLQVLYVRTPDVAGNNATTPGGRSLSTGGP